METRTLDTIVKEIKLTKKEFNITPRFYLNNVDTNVEHCIIVLL